MIPFFAIKSAICSDSESGKLFADSFSLGDFSIFFVFCLSARFLANVSLRFLFPRRRASFRRSSVIISRTHRPMVVFDTFRIFDIAKHDRPLEWRS